MEKGFKVLVIDNETGAEILNGPRAVGFLGVAGNDEDMHSVCRMKCGGIKIVQMIGEMQNLLIQILEDHPELDALATMIAQAEGRREAKAMNIEEAVKCIEDLINSNENCDESFGYNLTSEDFEWLQEVKKALKKQIPEKITHTDTLKKSCTCPNCGNCIDRFEGVGENTARVMFQYCHICGQALDWGK